MSEPRSPDIFISYNRQDMAVAQCFREALMAESLDVWWDMGLASGDVYDEVTERALRSAQVVVVLWSPRSVLSRWVRGEATIADRAGTMMPVMIEQCERPVMFELVQTTDLSTWRGNIVDPVWQSFVADLRRRLANEGRSVVQVARSTEFQLPSKPSIAVMPFTTMATGSEAVHIADGLVEEISTALAQFHTLFVIAGQSSLSYRDTSKPILQICRELGVRYLLEGSLRLSGDRVRVAVKLVDGIGSEQVWADKFDGTLDAVFELQDRIAHTVAALIDSTIDTVELKRAGARPSNNADAVALYWKANSIYRKWDPASMREAISLCERALELDPGNAWAASLAAFCSATLFQNQWAEDPAACRRRAIEWSDLAIRGGSDDQRVLGYVGAALGSVGGDPDAAGRLINRALELNPNSASTLFWGGWNDLVGGDYRRGLDRFEASLRLNPRSVVRPFTIAGMGLCLFFEGRYAESNRILWESVMLIPTYPAALAALAAGQALVGDPAAAATAARWRNCGASLGALAALQNTADRQLLVEALARAETLGGQEVPA